MRKEKAFRQLEFDGPRRKVNPRIVSYTWVPILEFRQTPLGREFFYLDYFLA